MRRLATLHTCVRTYTTAEKLQSYYCIYHGRCRNAATFTSRYCISSHLSLKGAQEANHKRVLCVCQYISLVEHLVHLQVEGAQGGGGEGRK